MEIKRLIITHLLLNLYLLVLVQPAIPVLEYLINYDYIVNELCENKDKPILTCNGKCYLGDQVEKQLDLDKDAPTPLPPQTNFKEFITLSTNMTPELSSMEEFHLNSVIFPEKLKDKLFASFLLRPPIV